MHRQSTGGASIRAAFTLIELLVVIAIIAILAAILFPVFAQAKAAAKKAAAISNAKQIILGEIMYSNDVDDMFVPYFSGYDVANKKYTDPQYYWPQLISPYVSKATGHGQGGQMVDTDLSGIFFDPAETIVPQTTANASYDFGNALSWGISDDIVDWWGPPGYSPSMYPRSNSVASQPANTLIFVETYDWINQKGLPGSAYARSYFDTASSDYPGVPTVGALRTVDAHYNGSYTKSCYIKSQCTNWYADLKAITITAFVDGHVKGLPAGSVTTSPQYWSLTGSSGNYVWP